MPRRKALRQGPLAPGNRRSHQGRGDSPMDRQNGGIVVRPVAEDDFIRAYSIAEIIFNTHDSIAFHDIVQALTTCFEQRKQESATASLLRMHALDRATEHPLLKPWIKSSPQGQVLVAESVIRAAAQEPLRSTPEHCEFDPASLLSRAMGRSQPCRA